MFIKGPSVSQMLPHSNRELTAGGGSDAELANHQINNFKTRPEQDLEQRIGGEPRIWWAGVGEAAPHKKTLGQSHLD